MEVIVAKRLELKERFVDVSEILGVTVEEDIYLGGR